MSQTVGSITSTFVLRQFEDVLMSRPDEKFLLPGNIGTITSILSLLINDYDFHLFLATNTPEPIIPPEEKEICVFILT